MFPYPRLSRAPIHSQQPVTVLGRIFETICGGIPLNMGLPGHSWPLNPPILLSPPSEGRTAPGVSERRIDPVHLVKPNRSLSGLMSGGFWLEAVNGTHAGAVTGLTDS